MTLSLPTSQETHAQLESIGLTPHLLLTPHFFYLKLTPMRLRGDDSLRDLHAVAVVAAVVNSRHFLHSLCLLLPLLE